MRDVDEPLLRAGLLILIRVIPLAQAFIRLPNILVRRGPVHYTNTLTSLRTGTRAEARTVEDFIQVGGADEQRAGEEERECGEREPDHGEQQTGGRESRE